MKITNINTLLLSGFLTLPLMGSEAVTKKAFSNAEITVYESANNSSKVIKSVPGNSVFQVYEEKFARGYPYLWYKTNEGWINVPYLINAPIKKEEAIVEKNVIVAEAVKPEPKPVPVLEAAAVKQEVEEVTASPVKEEPPLIVQEPKPLYQFFIGVNLGLNILDVEKKDSVGVIVLNNQIDEQALSFGIEAGLKYDTNYVAALNYERIALSDVDIDNIYISLSYQWDNLFNPYIGVLAGKSILKWKSDPLGSSTDTKLTSNRVGSYGIKGGTEYFFNKDYSYFTQFTYHELSHQSDLTVLNYVSTIKHNRNYQLMLGVRYWF